MPVIKMLSRRNLRAIGNSIRYILNEDKSEQSTPILSNLRAQAGQVDLIVNQMVANEAYRKVTADRVYCYHTILSFSDKDNLTSDALHDITQKYLELRGNVMAFAVPHFNTDAKHVHIVESATYFKENRSTTLRKSELSLLKRELEQYVELNYPEYSSSRVNHSQSNSYKSEKETQLENRTSSQKEQVANVVRSVYTKAKSLEDFLGELASKGLIHYERNNDGIPTGVVDQQSLKKYRFKTLGMDINAIMKLEQPKEKAQEQSLKDKLQAIRNNQTRSNQIER